MKIYILNKPYRKWHFDSFFHASSLKSIYTWIARVVAQKNRIYTWKILVSTPFATESGWEPVLINSFNLLIWQGLGKKYVQVQVREFYFVGIFFILGQKSGLACIYIPWNNTHDLNIDGHTDCELNRSSYLSCYWIQVKE